VSWKTANEVVNSWLRSLKGDHIGLAASEHFGVRNDLSAIAWNPIGGLSCCGSFIGKTRYVRSGL
jgi:hypothetical protein